MLDHRISLGLPAVWFRRLSEHAPQVIRKINRPGPRTHLNDWVREAIVEKAEKEGVKLEGGDDESKQAA